MACVRLAYSLNRKNRLIRGSVDFISPLADGRTLNTSSTRFDSRFGGEILLESQYQLLPLQLYQRHVDRLGLVMSPALPINDVSRAREVFEELHGKIRDYFLSSNIWKPLEQEDHQSISMFNRNMAAEQSGLIRHADVLSEIEEIQRKESKPSGNAFAILLFSLVLFVVLTKSTLGQGLAMLIPILFIHEAGHFIAMKVFKYKNVRMLFIPFLGAAVTGRNYNVPAWKQCIVSLAGPLPGILIGSALGIWSIATHHPGAREFAFMMIGLNAFNLLPIIPLDGGWIMHATVFSRSVALSVLFRIIAAGLLFFGYSRLDSPLLGFLGVIMLMGIPGVVFTQRIVSQLRKSGIRAVSADHQNIPPDVAQTIIDRIRESKAANQQPRHIAIKCMEVFRILNSEPPGALATLGICAGQIGGILASLAMLAVITLGFDRPTRKETPLNPRLALNAMEIRTVAGDRATAATTQPARLTLIAEYPAADIRHEAWTRVKSELPPMAAAAELGPVILMAFPMNETELSRQCAGVLTPGAAKVIVCGADKYYWMDLTCRAPDEQIATNIQETFNAYTDADSERLPLLPPWVTPDSRTEEQISRDNRARLTQQRFLRAGYGVPTAEQEKLFSQKDQARRKKDKAEIDRIDGKMKEIHLIRRKADIQRMRDEGPSRTDMEYLDRLLAIYPDEMKWPMPDEMMTPLGLIPKEEGQIQLIPLRQRMEDNFFVDLKKTTLEFRLLKAVDGVEGYPALIRWLAKQGCDQFKFEFAEPESDAEKDLELNKMEGI